MTKVRVFLITIVLLLVIFSGIWGIAKVKRVMRMAGDLKAEVSELKTVIAGTNSLDDLPIVMEDGRDGLDDIEANFTELRNEIYPFEGVFPYLGWIPKYGDDLTSVPHVLDLADALFDMMDQLDSGFSPLVDIVADEDFNGQETLITVADAITESEYYLQKAEQAFNEAHAARETIGSPDDLVPELQDVIREADQVLALADRGFSVTDTYLPPVAPLLGMDEPHHVLVLIQNADELRPTGGWITATAYIIVEQGQVTQVNILNSHDLDIDHFGELRYEEPPAPLRDYMHLPIWAFRDSNWSPDFPTSATQARELYTGGRQVPVDTVIAVDQYTLLDFLNTTGPLTLADLTTINHDNLISFLQQSWAESYKDILPEMAPLLIEKLLDVHSIEDVLQRWEAVKRSAEKNDLMIYSTIPSIQALVEELGWDGSIPVYDSDYLYPVEANISYNKVNLNIRRSMSYHVSLEDLTEPYSAVEIEYINQSQGQPGTCWDRLGHEGDYIDRAHDCYGNYLRLYLPNSSQMIQPPRFEIPAEYRFVDDPAAGQMQQLADERGKDVYGGLIVVPIGETLTADFTYRLSPEEIFSFRQDGSLVYKLLIQKQPGVSPYPLTVTIDLPVNTEVLEISPDPTYMDGSTVYFERTHGSDFELQMVMRVPDEQLAAIGEELPLEATPIASPTPRILPTLAPLPTLRPTPAPMPTPTATP